MIVVDEDFLYLMMLEVNSLPRMRSDLLDGMIGWIKKKYQREPENIERVKEKFIKVYEETRR